MATDNWHEIHSYNRKLADLCHITYYKNWLFSPQKHQARLQAGLQTLKTVPIFPVVDFVWFYQYIFMQQKYFFCFASNFSSSGHSLLICSWPLKSRKSLACDATDSSASHASLVRDVTDTDCLTPNGYAHCCFVFTTYRTKKKKNRKLLYTVLLTSFSKWSIAKYSIWQKRSKTSTHRDLTHKTKELLTQGSRTMPIIWNCASINAQIVEIHHAVSLVVVFCLFFQGGWGAHFSTLLFLIKCCNFFF